MDEREPLTEVSTQGTGDHKVAKVKPMSRLPTPGKSKLPLQGSRLCLPVPVDPQLLVDAPVTNISKRKADVESAPANKRARLNNTENVCGQARNVEARGVAARSATVHSRPPARKPGPSSSGTAVSSKPVSKAAQRPPSAKKPAAATTIPPATKGKKRAAWDLKGRLEDMESEMGSQTRTNSALQDQIAKATETLSALQSARNNLQGEVTVKSQAVDDLEAQLRHTQRDLDETSRTLGRKVDNLEFDKSTLERQKASLEGELTASQQEVGGLKVSVATLTAAQSGMSAELASTKSHLERVLVENKQLTEDLRSLRDAHAAMSEDYHQKMQAHETERRKLHNVIQELKGNIRVFCRVRPLLGEELLGNNGEIHHLQFPDDTTVQLEKVSDQNPNESVASTRKGPTNSRLDFTFDRVFSPSSEQAEVFKEISQLVQSALDGYHVCIFAYGQTGSGKTYTMEGPSQCDDTSQGMIPRAVEQVFATAQGLEDKGWEYMFEVSFMEIYNQTIRDLLGNGSDSMKHEIRMVSANSSEVTVTNLTTVQVLHPNEVYRLLKKASENRAVAETKCNARSSRSHSIFQMRITGKNSQTDENCIGLLNLIDLAGSERLKDSGSEGQRLKETQAINTSLSNLGNVIMALANKESHIPYRNSKLTHVLQHCLGGNSKVLMFANVSPKQECYAETLNSLRFATKVNSCNIGTAQQKN